MYSSLGALPARNRHSFEVIPGSASSIETTSPDPMFSTSTSSSHSSISNTYTRSNITDSAHTTPRALQQRVVSTASHHSSRTEASTSASHPYPSSSDDSISSFSAHTSPSSHHTTSDEHGSPVGSRFDSLHELLERAGYKETRVVTPDRQTLAGMFAKKLATPPRKPRLVDDFSSDSPSLAACELRRAVQKSRSTPKAATSKSLPSRNYKLASSADAASVPPLPEAPAPSSSWFSNIWFFGPGTILNDPPPAVEAESATNEETSQPSEAPACASTQNASSSTATASSSSASASASTSSSRPLPPKTKRTASNNPVWTASVAYRSSKSRTAPVRKSGAISAPSSDVLSSDAAAEQEWKALSNVTTKRRPGLVDAFASPTKKGAQSNARGTHDAHDSPSRQRQWKKDRAAWRESLGDLQAMMDQSRMRREAAAAAAAAASTTTANGCTDSDLTRSSTPPPSSQALPSQASKQSGDDAVTKLLSGPALPFLSTDPAVAPRNGSCTRPTHLSLRRMKSVEVLSQIMRERRSVSSTPSSSKLAVDTDAGRISPTMTRRTPPRLTVSSPRGISSPKELALEGVEFEPTSWSPAKANHVIISNRKVQKKPRSKLRHVSSGSDLREPGLSMPKRGRTKHRSPNTSPTKATRGPVAAILRDSMGSLSRGSTVQALRHNINVFEDHAQPPLVLTKSAAVGEEEDVFRTRPVLGGAVLKKKDFSARITRTSKIMRLIEEAENVPAVAAMSANGGRVALRAIAVPQAIQGEKQQAQKEEQTHGLSSSLSRKSRERMHTITRVLGQRQPAN